MYVLLTHSTTSLLLSCFPQVLLILASVVGIVVYRLAVFSVFSASNSFKSSTAISTLNQFGVSVSPRMTTSITASIVNFIIITILNMVYENVAKWVTDFGEAELLSTQE